MLWHALCLVLLCALLAPSCPVSAALSRTSNTTFINPVFAGWNSDPSCVYVPEANNTTFCVTSSFLNFPGLPIYASNDLIHWEHISNAFNRAEQILSHASMNGNPRGGIWAPTIRYRNDNFYIVVTYTTYEPTEKVYNLLFQTKNAYDGGSWGIPLTITNPGGSNHIDPDLFWDNGTAYMATGWGKIFLSTIDVETGNASNKVEIWTGTGGKNPEGPHLYKKDGFFYLLIAEGGAGIDHSVTIARSEDIYGPYESFAGNPVLTNRGTDELFQSVGHADLFQDANANWWAVALTTRSGPGMMSYPMGRETAMTAVTWNDGSWPVFDPVRGRMQGPVPTATESSDEGPPALIDAGDSIDFDSASSLPIHFVHFRSRIESKYAFYNNSLRLLPSQSNLTGSTGMFDTEDGVTFVGRKQTATKFSFTVDLSFSPTEPGDEAGITVFLSQQQHIDLSVLKMPDFEGPQLRMTATNYGRPTSPLPQTVQKSVPDTWASCPIRLLLEAFDAYSYKFTASSPCSNETVGMGTASSDVTSGGFLGSLIGIFATNNNGTGQTASHWNRWRYTPIAQEVDVDEYVDI